MKRKIIGISVCMLLITTTVFSVAGNLENTINQHQPPIYNPEREDIDDKHFPSEKSDFGFLGIEYTGWNPPDPIIAAGPEHVVVMTNGAIGFFQKDGTMDFQDEIEDSFGFWGEQGATGFVFDPEVIYDPHADRFMAMACERAPSSQSYFLLAISDDTDPNGDWYKYRLDVTALAGGDIDSPNIAVDSEVIYLTADFFTGGQKYLVYILEKEPMLTGGFGEARDMLITGSQSYGIPVTYGSPPAMYMIEHFEASSNTMLRLHAITDPLGTPQRETFDLTVPAYSPPENPPQMGTSARPNTFDSRFWSCVWRDGSLWATHHQGTARVMARWYEIDTCNWPSSGEPSLIQSGDIDPGPDIRTFFTSIAPDGYGNAAMCFARSSPNEYISMARCTRRSDDPLGTMRDVVIIKTSDAPYNGGRWGDYSGVSCDPSDDRTFWMNHEYTPGGDIWNTWISRCTAPNTPPNNPVITGPSIGTDGVEYEFDLVTTDPEGNDVYYMVDWGDVTIVDWIGPYPSGQKITVSHTWESIGEYEIRAKAKDEFDEESDWTSPVIIEIIENEPPSVPSITGTSQGEPGKLYDYYFTSTDSEGNEVSYYIEWGDGEITEWSAYQESGVILKESHEWQELGTFTISAKAKDSYGEEGDWGTFEISMPRNKLLTNIILMRLLQRFSNMFPLLQKLLS